MTTTKNRLRFDFADMPDLQAALGGLSSGDHCSLTLELMIVSCDDKSFEGNIEEVEYDLPDSESAEKSGEAEPSSEEPVMAVISARNAKDKKSKPVVDDPSNDGEAE